MRCTHHHVHHQSLAVSYSHTCTLLLYLAERFTHHTTLLFPGSCSLTYTHTLDTHFYPFTGSHCKTHTSTPLLDLMARHTHTFTPLLDLMASQTHTLPLYWISWQDKHILLPLYWISWQDTHILLPLYWISWQDTHILLPLYWISWQDTHSTPLLDLMARHSDNPPLFWILHWDIHTALLYLAVRYTHHSTVSNSEIYTPLYSFPVSCSLQWGIHAYTTLLYFFSILFVFYCILLFYCILQWHTTLIFYCILQRHTTLLFYCILQWDVHTTLPFYCILQ